MTILTVKNSTSKPKQNLVVAEDISFTIIKKPSLLTRQYKHSNTTKTYLSLISNEIGYNEYMENKKIIPKNKYTTLEKMAKANSTNKLMAFLTLHFARYGQDVTKIKAYIDSNDNAYSEKPRSIKTTQSFIYLYNEDKR